MYKQYEKLLMNKGVSTYQVCAATGLSQSTISTWKTRGGSLSVENLKKLADYFGVTIEYFLTGPEE